MNLLLHEASSTLNQKICKQIPGKLRCRGSSVLWGGGCKVRGVEGSRREGLSKDRGSSAGAVCAPERSLRLRRSVCGIFPSYSFTAQCSLLSLAGRSLIAINFLISSAFPIMDNNRKAVIGF